MQIVSIDRDLQQRYFSEAKEGRLINKSLAAQKDSAIDDSDKDTLALIPSANPSPTSAYLLTKSNKVRAIKSDEISR